MKIEPQLREPSNTSANLELKTIHIIFNTKAYNVH